MRSTIALPLLILPLVAGACADATEPAAGIGLSAEEIAQVIADNEARQAELTQVVAEIEPRLITDGSGRWSVDEPAALTPAALDYLAEAQWATQEYGLHIYSFTGPAYHIRGVSGNYTGWNCYWWGCRLSLSNDVIGAMAHAFTAAGVPAATRTTLIAARVPPQYAVLVEAAMWVVYWAVRATNWVGGSHGVHVNIAWVPGRSWVAPQ